MKLRTALLGVALISNQCFAMFCPSNFNTINIGDPIAKVEALCGKPANVKTEKSEKNQPQEWMYYLKLNPTDASTVKVTFMFVNDKVINLSSNGTSIGTTALCNGITLQVGNTMDEVKAACGPATMVTKSDSPEAKDAAATEVTEWKYDSTPPYTLVFENGLLKERK